MYIILRVLSNKCIYFLHHDFFSANTTFVCPVSSISLTAFCIGFPAGETRPVVEDLSPSFSWEGVVEILSLVAGPTVRFSGLSVLLNKFVIRTDMGGKFKPRPSVHAETSRTFVRNRSYSFTFSSARFCRRLSRIASIRAMFSFNVSCIHASLSAGASSRWKPAVGYRRFCT